ncbi:uncharacterized protein LOC142235960 [Haematobia irritans]|uniref:uncharacterized protein LOC142235960 n=1 Tax=Haematobia irritans TaxID=7368 RepID=UPI003F50CC5B
MSSLEVLIINQRDTLQLLVKYAKRFEKKAKSEKTHGYLNTLAQRVDEIFNKFEDQHDKIVSVIRDTSLDVDDVPYMKEDVYFDFTEKYLEFKGRIIDALPENSITNSPLASTFVAPSNRTDAAIISDSRLPKINLPKFSGEYVEWVPFRDMYCSLVHNNGSLNRVQKFYYLKGTLSGEAASLIKTIPVTEANYDSAWEVLESRYHNRRMLVGNLVSKLFNIPKSDGGCQSIRVLLDFARECLSSLGNLDIDTSNWDPILVHLLVQKLDLQTRKEWENSLKSSTNLPSRSELFTFLDRTFRTLESLGNEFSSSSASKSHSKFSKSTKNSNSFKKTSCHTGKISRQTPTECIYCGKSHSISKCYKFLALSVHGRNEFLSDKSICRNCLSVGHDQNNCGSPFRCVICKQKHHSVLHADGLSGQVFSAEPLVSSTSNSDTNPSNRFTTHNANVIRSVLLYTIRLHVCTNRGTFPLRALLDPGSQGCLISESAVQLMGLKRTKSHCTVVGIGDGSGSVSKFMVDIELFSRRNISVLSCTALVLTKLSSYTPDACAKSISMPDISEDDLADPRFYDSDPIDLILGSDVCFEVKIPSQSFIHNGMFFQNTHFGWVFSGSDRSLSTHRLHIHHVNLDAILRSFWEQEEICSDRDMSNEELACESYFVDTTNQTETGRYMVKLPFKSILSDGSSPEIQNNILNAFRRLRQLEISFSRRPEFAQSYKNFMSEYESLGHMTRIGHYPDHVRRDSYFLPHHGIFKEQSTTTKLRVVFDGSSHSQGHKSLNEELAAGPALQNDISSILTKWRRHRIAFGADIEKMFRQIDVHPEHRKYQQILWRANPFEDISIFELNTVTYGTTSAPYLAIRVLQKLAEDYRSHFPSAAEVLMSESYVDDIISGSDNLSDASKLQKDLCALLNKGGCNLRKWVTNSQELLAAIPFDCRDPSISIDFDRNNNVVKTLGIQWNTSDDTFSIRVNFDERESFSKRSILSESARIYDPLGLLTPSTVVSKTIFKRLWEDSIDWDSKIPNDIERDWINHRSSLKDLSSLKVPRWIGWSPNSVVELHCFCDASSVAYAAVVYARILTPGGIRVSILQAKSKVAPVKTVSIPRLELCAAKLLALLVQNVKESLKNLPIETTYFWSDSSTVLSWIRKSPSHWTVYVANRVADIQRLSDPFQWRYVPTSLNPADCASRGISGTELLNNDTWWFGPRFLRESTDSWPRNLPQFNTTEEQRTKISTHALNEKTYPEIFLRYSKFNNLIRSFSLCYRFIYNCRKPDARRTGVLTSTEINDTLYRILKVAQKVDFPIEIEQLLKNRPIRSSSLLKLMPFLDTYGLIRVGGRLQNSSFDYDIKHPIILSKNNPLSRLIITDSHEKTLHGGITLTMSYVNRRYWILSGNQLAKSIIHKCMRCFRQSAKTAQQIMGNLPSVRLNATRPFKHSGVDFAGPIMLKISTIRSAVVTKGYICLFVCMVTKALHLEAVSDLSTSAFLAAFKRFVSRRGGCTDIYSDCGTNFVGASKELQVLHNRSQKSLPEELRHALSNDGTTWHFIPPASPNFGGLWEAGVKSVKYHLKRVVRDRLLSFEELSTLLCQIESILNSRPLCPLSPDPADFDALTPAHFLIGEPTNCIQDETLLDVNINRLTRWKCIEKIKQHFWKRWHSEYLNRLQSRPKWLKQSENAKVGDLVLVADERIGPGQWLLGRIKEIHPGGDGRTRLTIISTDNHKIISCHTASINYIIITSTANT